MDTFESFLELNLSEKIQENLKKLKFEKPTQIQQLSLTNAITKGQDILGCAETGSGKTLAYGLPILNDLINRYV